MENAHQTADLFLTFDGPLLERATAVFMWTAAFLVMVWVGIFLLRHAWKMVKGRRLDVPLKKILWGLGVVLFIPGLLSQEIVFLATGGLTGLILPAGIIAWVLAALVVLVRTLRAWRTWGTSLRKSLGTGDTPIIPPGMRVRPQRLSALVTLIAIAVGLWGAWALPEFYETGSVQGFAIKFLAYLFVGFFSAAMFLWIPARAFLGKDRTPSLYYLGSAWTILLVFALALGDSGPYPLLVNAFKYHPNVENLGIALFSVNFFWIGHRLLMQSGRLSDGSPANPPPRRRTLLAILAVLIALGISGEQEVFQLANGMVMLPLVFGAVFWSLAALRILVRRMMRKLVLREKPTTGGDATGHSADTEYTVVVSGPEFTFRPFPSLERAKTFLRRWVRDSIEDLRQPDEPPERLFERWFAQGETGAIVGAGFSVFGEIDAWVDTPATEEERDWRSLKDLLGGRSHLEDKKDKEAYWEACTVFARDRGDPSGREQKIEGFPTMKLAVEFINRVVRDSIENLRSPELSGEALKERWEKEGRDAGIRGGYSGWDAIHEAVENPALPLDRDWRSIQDLVEGGAFVKPPGEEGQAVAVWKMADGPENPERVIDGFPNSELAREFVRRFSRHSIEGLRTAGDDAGSLLRRWMREGKCAGLVDGGSSGYEFLTLHADLDRPATTEEMDWQAILWGLRKPGRPALARHQTPALDLSQGFQLEKPNILIPWEITEKAARHLLAPYAPEQLPDGNFSIPCVSMGGLEHKLGLQFDRDGTGRLSKLHIGVERTMGFAGVFWHVQRHMEAAFGRPTDIEQPDPRVYNLPSSRWDQRHVRIEHRVMERFGPKEHRDLHNHYIENDDRRVMEIVNAALDDDSLGQTPVFTLVTGRPCAGKTTHVSENLARGNVVVDAAAILGQLTGGKAQGFGTVMKYPMDYIGRRILRRALRERRNIVVELWPQSPETLESLLSQLKDLGYRTKVIDLDCEESTAIERNRDREAGNISSYFTSPYHLRWLSDELPGALVEHIIDEHYSVSSPEELDRHDGKGGWVEKWYRCGRCGAQQRIRVRDLESDARSFEWDIDDLNRGIEASATCQNCGAQGEMMPDALEVP